MKSILNKIFNLRKKKDLVETYYERLMRLKPMIESSDEIMRNISSVFLHVYFNEKLNAGISYLGRGDQHILHNVGKIEDLANKKIVHLATRLNYEFPYNLKDERSWMLINENLTEFQNAFEKGKNAPYFCSIINWHNDNQKIAGMLLEDVSENRKYSLIETGTMHQEFERNDGKRFFLDPLCLGGSCISHYSNKEAIINFGE